ncbi:MAG: type IV secretion system DNA-binding domain-containing protein [Verrucomicrobia bacterium]|nr:type IV secretion system DNA-binding domain-containing protein [Verrucomicrobiota bacterium]
MIRQQLLPDGYFLGDVLFWGSATGPDAVFSRGFDLSVPDLATLGTAARNDWHEGWQAFLSGLAPDHALQVQFAPTSDYRLELERYELAYAEEAAGPWSHFVRQQRAEGLRAAMQAGSLRRERLTLWVGRRAGPGLARFAPAAQIQAAAEAIGCALAERVQALTMHLPAGSRATPLDAAGHYRELRRFFAPGLPPEQIEGEVFDPFDTVLGQCLSSDVGSSRLRDGEVCLRPDGRPHAFLVVTGWPVEFRPGLMLPLLRAPLTDYRITQLFLPVDPAAELRQAEKDLDRLARQMRGGAQNLETPHEHARQRVLALQEGRTLPLRSLTVATVWAPTAQELSARLATLRTSLGALQGARHHVASEPSQALRIYEETFPGRVSGRVRDWDLADSSERLASWVCAGNTATGDLAVAEAIYETDQGGLAGVALFRGGQPQHFLALGGQGSGKSIFLFDLLSQAWPSLGFCIIIDEGRSYEAFVQLQGGVTLMPHPEADDFCLNPLDPQGLPMSEAVVAAAIGLTSKMARVPAGEAGAVDRALLERALQEVLDGVAADAWTDDEAGQLDALAEARLIEWWQPEACRRAGENLSFIDAWLDLREVAASDPEWATQALASFRADEQGLLSFLHTAEGRRLARNLTLGRLASADQPTLSVLAAALEDLEGDALQQARARELAARLQPWCRGGRYGALFDGPTTLDLSAQRLVYFELSRIGRSAEELKDVLFYFLSEFSRREILRRPRAQGKLLLMDELARASKNAEGMALAGESVEQLRKYGCCFGGVFQSPSQIDAVLGLSSLRENLKQWFLLKQLTAEAAAKLSAMVGLTDQARARLTQFPAPEHQPAESRAAFVLHARRGGARLETNTLRVRVSEEVLYAGESSGEVFDRRRAALAAHDDPVEAIRAEVIYRQAGLPPAPAARPTLPALPTV